MKNGIGTNKRNMKNATVVPPAYCITREESSSLERAERETTNPVYWVRQPKN